MQAHGGFQPAKEGVNLSCWGDYSRKYFFRKYGFCYI